MPELPEVQTTVDELQESGVLALTFEQVEVFWERTVGGMNSKELTALVQGGRVNRLYRRAKYIVWELDTGGFFLIHLRMTGQFGWLQEGAHRGAHDHVIFTFDNGTRLYFRDTRKFGRILYFEQFPPVLNQLGPEPLDDDFTDSLFLRALHTRQCRIKPLLLNQKFLAGVGNIYADEALFEAGIHPETPANRISKSKACQLRASIVLVLKRGLKNMGTSLGTRQANYYSVSGRSGRNQDELKVFRRTGQSCERCQTKIERILVSQRSTHICPRCQKRPSS